MREVIGRGTPNRRGTWGLAAALAIFILFLGMPTVASVGKHHLLKIYKVEKHLDLQGTAPGNYAHEHVFCNPGDYAVDGMWRVACYDHSKAIVGAVGIAPSYHGFIHFLGMDPRPKSRAFKFWNTDPFNDLPV